jgi:hypothetical protein
MRLTDLASRAKQLIDRRGGTGAAKEDAGEVSEIARGPGSLTDKAKQAAEALKEPGAADTGAADTGTAGSGTADTAGAEADPGRPSSRDRRPRRRG